MNKFTRTLTAAAVAGVLCLGTFGGALASNHTDSETITVTIADGVLSVSVAVTTAFGSANFSPTVPIVADDGVITIVAGDGRSTIGSWSVDASLGNFTGGVVGTLGLGAPTVAPSSASNGAVNVISGAASPVDVLSYVHSAGTDRSWSAVYDAQVSLPAGTAAGSASATLTVNIGADA